MKLNEMYPSNWLGQTDVPSPIIATIKELKQEPVKGQRGTEIKIVVHFTGTLKPWILNKGNAKRLVALYGDDSSAWVGKSIEIYTDPTVEFAGDIVGGLRLRAPSQQTATSNNSHAAPNQPLIERWDITDGTNKLANVSTQEVQDFLADSKVPLTSIWVKPAGTDRNAAKTADKWNFTTPHPATDAFAEIPF